MASGTACTVSAAPATEAVCDRRWAGSSVGMTGSRMIRVVAAAAVLVACFAAASATAAARLPTVMNGYDGRYVVRPSSIDNTGDGSGVVGVLRPGLRSHGPGRGSLTWTEWNDHRAAGSGTLWIKLGTPTSTSPWTRFAMTVDLRRVRDGHFTRMTTHWRQGGKNASYTQCVPDREHVTEWGIILKGRCLG
jgi:hypothetical protein